MDIKVLSSEAGTWFDINLREQVQGIIYRYNIQEPYSGQWIVEVCISEKPVKAIVRAIQGEHLGGIYDQVCRKTDVFLPCQDNSEILYHPLGIAYLDSTGRLRYQRVSKEVEVPEGILLEYPLTFYVNVAPHTRNHALQYKLVALIPRNKPEQMAKLFILEKVQPLFSRSE